MSFVFIALLFAGAACSSSESPTISESSAPSTAPTATVAASVKTFTTKTFTLVLKQDNDAGKYYFEPATIKAPKGSTVTVQLQNVGSVEHNFTIDALHIAKDVANGKSATVNLTLGSLAKYDFYCKYHKSSGMVGVFELT